MRLGAMELRIFVRCLDGIIWGNVLEVEVEVEVKVEDR
jgi:hypothetical protein